MTTTAARRETGMDLTFETLLVETPEPGILQVTMNRPEASMATAEA